MKKKILALCLVVVLAVTAVTGATLAYFTDTTDVVENTFTMGKVKIDLDEAKTDEDGKAVTPEERVKENDYTDTNMVPGHVFDKDPTIHVEKGSEESYIFLDMTINKYSSLFWVMAADAADDAEINLALYQTDDEGKRIIATDNEGNPLENDEGEQYYVLAEAFQNDKGTFSTTKFINYMLANKEAFQTMINKWFTGIEHTDWEICDIFMAVAKDDVNADGKYLTIRFAYQGDTDGNVNTVNTKEATENLDIQFMESFQMPTSVTQKMLSDGKDVGKMANSFNTEAEEFHMNFTAYAIQADELDTLAEAYKAMFDMEKDDTILNG